MSIDDKLNYFIAKGYGNSIPDGESKWLRHELGLDNAAPPHHRADLWLILLELNSIDTENLNSGKLEYFQTHGADAGLEARADVESSFWQNKLAALP